MAESVLFKPLSVAFAIVTLIESLIWSILSFLAILCYNDIITYDSKLNYGLNNFMKNLQKLYLSGEYFPKGRFVTPDVFYTLMWLFFLLSLFLCFASGAHISVLTQKSNIRKINVSTLVWLILTYTVCLYDLITCILFGVDYNLIRENLKKDTEETEVEVAVVLTLVVLAAKGFVLWIANFVFSVIITILLRNKVTLNNEPFIRTGPPIHARNYSAYDAYGDVTIDDNNVEVNNNNNLPKNQSSSYNPEEESSAPYPSMNDSTWFTKLSVENSRRSYALSERGSSPTVDPLDEILSSTLPRASSFRRPRSLAASLSPSPVPLPSKESPTSGRKSAPPSVWDIDRAQGAYSSGYRTDDERREDDEYDDDEDDVSESMSKMVTVFPQHRRFNLDEPDPDYESKF